MNHGRVSSWLLVGIAIFVVLGHICAAPLHAHAGAVTTHNEEHQHGGDGDEAVHAGSCEALRADFGVHTPALPPTGIVLPVVRDPEINHAPPTQVSASTSSLPLFLLHAALLI